MLPLMLLYGLFAGPPTPAPVAETTADARASADELEPRPRLSFGPGRGLTITSANGQHGLQIGLFAQMLYTFARTPTDTPVYEHGFELRRARLRMQGHIFGPHNKMFMHLGFSPRDMQFVDGRPTKTLIFDWWLEFDHVRDAVFRVGQFRVPFSRERRVAIADVDFVDRSLANFEFNLDRDIGFDIRSDDIGGLGLLRYDAGIFVGEGRDGYELGDFGLLYVARLELLPLGLFDDYRQADLERHRKPKLSIGLAHAFLDQAKGNRGVLGSAPTDGGTTDTHNVTGDLAFKFVGLSMLGEVFWRHGTRDYGDAVIVDEAGVEMPAPRELPRDGLGWVAQLGYVLPWVPLEAIVRQSGVVPLGDSSLERREELGAGLQWFIHGTALELAVDYFRTYDDTAIADGSDRVRVQLQMAF